MDQSHPITGPASEGDGIVLGNADLGCRWVHRALTQEERLKRLLYKQSKATVENRSPVGESRGAPLIPAHLSEYPEKIAAQYLLYIIRAVAPIE